jgi:hypothetical protein
VPPHRHDPEDIAMRRRRPPTPPVPDHTPPDRQPPPRPGRHRPRTAPLLAVSLLTLALLAGGTAAGAQTTPVLDRGDAVVTGFPGIVPSGRTPAAGESPLDHFLIDVEAPAARILSLRTLAGPPQGQLVAPGPKLDVKAGQIGQVFAVALDGTRRPGGTPDALLGATAAYGLHIVDGSGAGGAPPRRLRRGKADARWMSGQFGLDAGGGPGSIWRVDGITGAPTLFANLPSNSGPGIGDIVVDPATGQVFASDLDTGLVYRLSTDGAVLDSYDHGMAGRLVRGLAPVVDDGRRADITDPAFDVTRPDTWGFTQPERRVGALAIRDGRLYYTVAAGQQIWSVGIAGGGFAGDARWEFDVSGLPTDSPVTDMLFDGEGRLVLSQRGVQRAAYDYGVYAEPARAAVARFRRESPDDPATAGSWVPAPETYAVGTEPAHRFAGGGIALGYRHDETGALRAGTCNTTLWTTGDRLRASGSDATVRDVHGLQGMDATLVEPQNAPPTQAYVVDYDHRFGDAEKAGHVGDVEIHQPCGGPDFAGIGAPGVGGSGVIPPGYLPPGDTPPPAFPDPEYPYRANLELRKFAAGACVPWGAGHACRYDIRVRNTGPDAYFAPIVVRDELPTAPAGAVMAFAGAPWACWNAGPSQYGCWRPATFLAPGASVWLTAWAWVPNVHPHCHLDNVAGITWTPGGSPSNADPLDDVDAATATIPAAHCPPPGGPTNLKLVKDADPEECFPAGAGLRCRFRITVTNTGPGVYVGNIVVRDTPPAGTSAMFSPSWACGPVGGSYDCTRGAVLLNPTQSVFLWAAVDVSYAKVRQLGCTVENRARILLAAGGTPANTNPGDDADDAVAIFDDPDCHIQPVPAAEKASPLECPAGFDAVGGTCEPRRTGQPLPPPVIPPPPPPRRPDDPPRVCPKGTVGTPPNCRRPQRPEVDDDDPPPPRVCPQGTVGTPPNCRRVVVDPPPPPPRVCPQGTVGRPPNCRPIVRVCPTGMIGTPPNCRPIVRVCPPGLVGRPPNCRKPEVIRPRVCPPGTVGRPPVCRPLILRVPEQFRPRPNFGPRPDLQQRPSPTVRPQLNLNRGPSPNLR